MKIGKAGVFFLMVVLLGGAPAWAGDAQHDNDYTIPAVQVNETLQPGPIQQEQSRPGSVDVLTKDTIQTFSAPGGTTPYKALTLLPSVNSESDDPYGLVQNQNSLRIRGQLGDSSTRFSQTINGLPIMGSRLPKVMGSLMDMSNLHSLTLYKGAVPADQGFGFGNTAGSLDLTIERPADTFGITAEQKVGSYAFTRSFARVDSGALPGIGTRLFGSFSYGQENKWRGKGSISNLNFMAGIAQNLFDDRVKIEAYGLYNSFTSDEFRPLTYAQTQNMSNYRGFDYTGEWTGSPSIDWNYYDLNRQYYGQGAVFGNLECRLWQGATVNFKPYYSKNRGESYSTPVSDTVPSAKSLGVTVADIRQDQLGYVAQFEQKVEHLDVKVGFWHDNSAFFPQPQASQRLYLLTASGMNFNSWSNLSKLGDHISDAPFLQLKSDWGKLHLEGGLKYLQTNLPWATAFNTTNIPNVSYDNAFNYFPYTTTTVGSGTSKRTVVVPLAPIKAATGSSLKEVWLPNAGVSYDITEQLTVRFMYGKNYAYPTIGPLYNTYLKNLTTFQSAGTSLGQLWSDAKLETSDNFDVGVRYNNGTFSIAPTFFYAIYNDKIVTAYDPLTKLSYAQGVGSAQSIGGELNTAWKPYAWLTLFGSGSYNSFTFTKDLPGANGITRAKGSQIPDVPLWLFKAGFTATYEGFSVTPLYRYVDTRYADVQHSMRISGYSVVDLKFAYKRAELWNMKDVTLSLDFQNLFDQRYIGTINSGSSDDSRLDDNTTFKVGAPFTVVAGVKVGF